MAQLTGTQARLLSRLDRLLAERGPVVRRAFESAIAQIRDNIAFKAVVDAIASGNVLAAADAVYGSGLSNAATAMIVRSIADTFSRGGQIVSNADLPRIVTAAGGTLARFTWNPNIGPAQEVLAGYVQQMVPQLLGQARAGFVDVISRGLAAGINPRQVAVEARQFIGLTPYDNSLIQSFRADVINAIAGDPKVLTRALRDQRYDSILEKLIAGQGTITQAKIDSMVLAYGRKLLANRAEAWSRTASLGALKNAQFGAWLNFADAAGVDEQDIVKTWVTTLDGRERDEHHDAHGTTVGINELYPVDGGVMVPGDGVYNCRCTQVISVLPVNATRRADFLAASSRQPLGQREDQQRAA